MNRDRQGLRPLADTDIAASGTNVWLKGYGKVKVFTMVSAHGDIRYWATNDLTMTELDRLNRADVSWKIEHYHFNVASFVHTLGRSQRHLSGTSRSYRPRYRRRLVMRNCEIGLRGRVMISLTIA